MAAICTIKVGRVEAYTLSQINDSTMEIDNHTDIIVLEYNFLQINDFERSVYVSGWYASSGSVECPTISGDIAYDHPIIGQVSMLVYHQSIHFPILTNNLICLMKSLLAGVRINELPKFLAEDPDEKKHAIIVNGPLNPNEPLIIPLVLKGFNTYFTSRNPRASEYEDKSIPHIDITSEAMVWEPCKTGFAEQEDSMTDFRREVISSGPIARVKRLINFLSISKYDTVDFKDDEHFFNVLDSKVNMARVGSSKGRYGVTSE